MQPTRTRTRRHSLPAIAALLLAGGCGGGAEQAAPPPRPAIEPAVAEELAARSDEIAALLEHGDVCSAAARADELQAQVIAAINAGAVPPRFQEELSAKANELVDTVNCAPPEEDEDEDEVGGENGHGKKKGKKKKQDEAAGDEGITVELPIVTGEDE